MSAPPRFVAGVAPGPGRFPGYTYEEAARIADVRVGTIRSRVTRTRARKELIDAAEAQPWEWATKAERGKCGHGEAPAIRFPRMTGASRCLA